MSASALWQQMRLPTRSGLPTLHSERGICLQIRPMSGLACSRELIQAIRSNALLNFTGNGGAIGVFLYPAKQLGMSIKIATSPHERVAGLQYDSVFAMSPFLQFTNGINANQ